MTGTPRGRFGRRSRCRRSHRRRSRRGRSSPIRRSPSRPAPHRRPPRPRCSLRRWHPACPSPRWRSHPVLDPRRCLPTHPTQHDAPAARSSAPDWPSSRLRSRRRCRPRHCHHRHRRRPRSPLRAPSTSRSAPERAGRSRPSENGFAPSPRTAATRPSSTSSTSVQAPGHSSQTTTGPQGRRLFGRRLVGAGRALRRPLRQPRLDSDPNPMPRFPPPRLRHQPESLSASISWTNVSFAQARVLLAQAYSHPVS